jgi:hypothetical protein
MASRHYCLGERRNIHTPMIANPRIWARFASNVSVNNFLYARHLSKHRREHKTSVQKQSLAKRT